MIDLDAAMDFVTRATRLQQPPRVPELYLHLADDMTAMWSMTEAELRVASVEPPYWAFAWAGGQAVARHLLDTPEEVQGKRIVDLASGSGLVALAALAAGAAHATSLDVDPMAGAAALVNARANGLLHRVTVVTSDVLSDPGLLEGADVVVAGDVCYDRDMTPRVLQALRKAAAGGARVLLGDPRRTYLPKSGLDLIATYDVPTTADLEGREVCPSSVYSLG